MILIIDNYDSFTYNLVQYIRAHEPVKVVKNDAITVAEIEALAPTAIVLSPGPSNPDYAGISLEIVRKLHDRFPILGVCLGHQIVAQAFGARIVKGREPVHGKQFELYHDGKGLYENIASSTKIGRYHSLIVEEASLPECLEVTSRTADSTIMGLRHKNGLVETVQFHPESILTEDGKAMIVNFLKGVARHGK